MLKSTSNMIEDLILPAVPESIGLPADVQDAYFGWFRVTGQIQAAADNASLIGTFNEATDGNVAYLSTTDFRFMATHYLASISPSSAADIQDGNAYKVAKTLQLKWQAAGQRTTRYHPVLWVAQPVFVTDGTTLGSPTVSRGGVDLAVPQKFNNGPLHVNDGGTLKVVHNATLAGTCDVVVAMFGIISSDNDWLSRYSCYCASTDSGAPRVLRAPRRDGRVSGISPGGINR